MPRFLMFLDAPNRPSNYLVVLEFTEASHSSRTSDSLVNIVPDK